MTNPCAAKRGGLKPGVSPRSNENRKNNTGTLGVEIIEPSWFLPERRAGTGIEEKENK